MAPRSRVTAIFRLFQDQDPGPSEINRLKSCDEARSRPSLIRWLLEQISVILSLVKETHDVASDGPQQKEREVEKEAAEPGQGRAKSNSRATPEIVV